MVLSGGRLAKETNNEGGVKDFTVTPVTDEDDKIHNAQDVNVVNSNDIEVKMTGEGLATSAKQADLDAHNASKVSLYDSNGNEIDFSNIEILFPTPLKADRITAITTSGGSVSQTGIQKASVVNSGNTTIIIWFGEAPDTSKSIYLSPGQTWNDYVNNKSGFYYDSDANNGQLDYVLLGSE